MSGILFAIVAAIGFGIFQFMNRKAGSDFPPILATFILIGVSTLILIFAALVSSDISLLWASPFRAVIYFAIAGFIHFFAGWTLVTISQNQIGAARTSAVLGAMPFFGLLIDLVLFQESFAWQSYLGLVLIVGGVLIISFR